MNVPIFEVRDVVTFGRIGRETIEGKFDVQNVFIQFPCGFRNCRICDRLPILFGDGSNVAPGYVRDGRGRVWRVGS